MDQQKFASCAQVLAKALVEKAKEMDNPYDPEIGHILPSFPLHEARNIMTRADFIEQVGPVQSSPDSSFSNPSTNHTCPHPTPPTD